MLELVSSIKFFKDKDPKTEELEDICKALSFETLEADQDVFVYGN